MGLTISSTYHFSHIFPDRREYTICRQSPERKASAKLEKAFKHLAVRAHARKRCVLAQPGYSRLPGQTPGGF